MKKQILFAQLVLLVATVLATSAQAQNLADKVTLEQNDKPTKNDLNTATVVIAGKKCSLTLIGDMLPDLFIDGKQIPASQIDEYTAETDSLSHVIWAKQRKDAERKDAAIAKAKLQILEELSSTKYGFSRKNVQSFYLTSKEFFVNKKLQSADVFAHFKSKYLKSDDKAFYYEKNIQ